MAVSANPSKAISVPRYLAAMVVPLQALSWITAAITALSAPRTRPALVSLLASQALIMVINTRWLGIWKLRGWQILETSLAGSCSENKESRGLGIE